MWFFTSSSLITSETFSTTSEICFLRNPSGPQSSLACLRCNSNSTLYLKQSRDQEAKFSRKQQNDVEHASLLNEEYRFDQQRLIWYGLWDLMCSIKSHRRKIPYRPLLIKPVFSLLANAEKTVFAKLVFQCLLNEEIWLSLKQVTKMTFAF